MATVVAFDDARASQSGHERAGKTGRGKVLRTRFFGSRDQPELPHATLNEHEPGTYTGPHFHLNDQFQVIVRGRGKLGRHDLVPYSVHFSRAYTPYGPLMSDPEIGFAFFVMRPHLELRSYHLPEHRDMLDQVRDREPWQITRTVEFPETNAALSAIQLIDGMQDEQGLAVYKLSLEANASAKAPDASHGDGQYILVLSGSLRSEGKEHRAYTLVFSKPNEYSFSLHAGERGLQALVLNFPRRETRRFPDCSRAISRG